MRIKDILIIVLVCALFGGCATLSKPKNLLEVQRGTIRSIILIRQVSGLESLSKKRRTHKLNLENGYH